MWAWGHFSKLLFTGLFIFPAALSARTWVIPHVLETNGRITTSSYSFDTQLTILSPAPTDGVSNGPISLELFLYDNNDQPMAGNLGPVCNPCVLEMGGTAKQTNLTIGDLIESQGGGFDQLTKIGYAVIKGDDAATGRLKLEARVLNSLATVSNLSGFTFAPTEIQENNPSPSARAFVIPHILEKQGSISGTPFSFDTTVFATYTPASPTGGGATVDLYLYDEAGQPLQGATSTVCNPCTFQLSDTRRKQSIRIDDLIVNAGGFGGTTVKLGFGIIVVGGSDPDGVALQNFVVNSHTSAFDLSVFGFEPQPIAAAARTYVIPHVLETSGKISDTQFTFDTTIFATYSPGLAGTPTNAGASVDLYLYESSGQPMQGGGGNVCNPCTFNLSSAVPYLKIEMEDLIISAGGFGGQLVKTGFAVIELNGSDPTNVVLQTQIANAHTSAFDLSVFTFEPQELAAAAKGGGGVGTEKKTFVLPHVLEKSGRIISSQNALDTTINVTLASPPSSPQSGITYVDLFLFDEVGTPLRGVMREVCYPCTLQLTGPNQKSSFSLEEKFTNAGGFDAAVKLGFGVIVVSGPGADYVNVQGFVVNSHTGPFDLSVFGFDPVPIEAAPLILPLLSTTSQGGNLVLSWSTNSPGFAVEKSDALGSGGWAPLGIEPAIVGREYVVTNSVTTTNTFLRLQRP